MNKKVLGIVSICVALVLIIGSIIIITSNNNKKTTKNNNESNQEMDIDNRENEENDQEEKEEQKEENKEPDLVEGEKEEKEESKEEEKKEEETPTPTPTPTPAPQPKQPTIENVDYIEAYFLNSINNPTFINTYSNNDAFIFKTNNNKYVLLDAGEHYKGEEKTFEVINLIYNKLKELQKKDIVTIDYLIVSHMHYDHAGNVADLLLDSRFDVKNLIFKRESIQTLTTEVYNAAVKNGKVNIIEVNKSLQEGASYTLNDNVKMYLFNLSDAFLGAKGCKSISYFNFLWDEYKDKNAVRDSESDGNLDYLYFNGADYLSNESNFKFFPTAKNDVIVNTNDYMFSRFYVVQQTGGYTCNANTNSIVVVFQVLTSKGNKYIYLPADIENNGYDPFGEYDSNLKTTIHGGVATYPYLTRVSGENYIYAFRDGNRLRKNPDIKTFPIAAEYLTAKKVVEKFNDIKGNITIYQESHHALNNAPEATTLLGVNSKSTYSIAPTGRNPLTSNQFRVLRGQQYLKYSNIMYTGKSNKNGIKCTINGNGTTTCKEY